MTSFNIFDAVFGRGRPSDPAILYEQREISYADLREAVIDAAATLQSGGVTAGDRVAMLLPDSPEFIASFLGACALNAIPVPINPALRLIDQQLILNECGVSACVVEGDAGVDIFKGAAGGLPDLKALFVVERSGKGRLPDVSGVTVRLFDVASPSRANRNVPPSGPEPPSSFILLTSGSTGKPKGAVHSQASLAFTVETYCREVLKVRSGDRLFSSSRLPFAYGLGNSLSFPLLNGACSILCRDKPLPPVISRIFADDRPTIFFGVPAVYNLLLEYHRQGGRLDCSSLRICVSAGESLPARIGAEWQRIFGVEVLDGIGSTEMLHIFISNHEGESRYGSSGRLVTGYSARLLDDAGEPVPDGEAGNLWVRGASAASRYWQGPEATARTFVDGWVRTGDLYRRDREGYYYHMGRSDDCFKSRGRWVSPVEIESVLFGHARVVQVAVVEGRDDHGLSCVCAFIVADRSNAMGLEDELRELSASTLPRFQQPHRYFFIAEMPYTATGKIQRFILRAQLRGDGTSPNFRGVRSPGL